MSGATPDGALPPTPSQTVGPFFSFGLEWKDGPFAVPEGTAGAIRIEGRLLDGLGHPVPDGLIETWQADPDGRFAHPDDPRGAVEWGDFRGFARCPTDGEGRWSVLTLKPGPIPGPGDSVQAPHLAVTVLARGLLARLVTRIYFADEEERNAADPVLRSLRGGDKERATMIAAPVEGGYRHDIHLQGPDETVFLAI
ncbi:MAG TPA: protocatechuate 3,4-dioxygenase subunit alpha [Solirubrobacterales bacterium]|nr:protocatechuate 3,4-dioxygenase subunit alpha [Solirubrobacterales bacterium]